MGRTIYRALTEDERRARDNALAYLAEASGFAQPLPLALLQRLFDQALRERLAGQDDLVIALGISFGQTFMEVADLEWVRVIDEYGEETVLAPKGYQLNAAPIAMIQKRLKRGERADLARLREEAVTLMEQRIAAGEVAPR